MTNEEAIKWIKYHIDISDYEETDELLKAFELAIKALEQQPCEDAISRQAVLEIQAKYAEHMGATRYWQMRDDVRALPSVTKQPKTGRWAILKDEYGDIVDAVCSCCDEHGNHKWTFCPHCGAKMEDVEQES